MLFLKLKDAFKNLEKLTLKIMKIGVICSFAITIIATIILITYLYFIHNPLIYTLGFLLFELSLHFIAYFIICGIAVDTIKKQII